MRCSAVVKMLSTALLVPYICSLCYGFVLLSSSVKALDANIFEFQQAWLYKFTSKTLMNEKFGDSTKSVGFYIEADVLIESIWENSSFETQQKLIRIQLLQPELHIKSRKKSDEDGFIKHSSMLDHLDSYEFYALWIKGRVDKLLFNKKETTSLANVKKGIASLLQFQLLDTEQREIDSSGKCLVTYESQGPHTFLKTKSDCVSDDLYLIRNPRELLQTAVDSFAHTKYSLSENHLVTIESKEKHVAHLAAKEDVGGEILVEQSLRFRESREAKGVLQGETFEDVLVKINEVAEVTEETLATEVEHQFDDVASFPDSVAELRASLKVIGGVQSATAFLKLVQVGRRATFEEIVKTLNAKGNKKILPQLLDILGYTQTSASHAAVSKLFHLDDQKNADLNERYLWALSFSSQPNPEIIVDLLNKYKKTQNIPEKIKDTLISSIASMARNLNLRRVDQKVHREVEKTIINYLDASKDAEERAQLLRALVNLQSPSTLDHLLIISSTSKAKEAVIAWKAIQKLNLKQLTPKLERAALRTFLNFDKDHDTSARTIALDVLLESGPSDEILKEIIRYLLRKCNKREVQQYTLQRLQMFIEREDQLSARIRHLIVSNPEINNYHTLARRGLSVAMSRSLYSGESSNGTLNTVQEMQSGQVKRGIVSINLENRDFAEELFALGIFSSGLGSFMQSTEETTSEESMIGGMELAVLGTQIRPFVFFNGQGELMGHVWSGTGSERTSAFQALVLMHDHRQFLRLGNGFIAELDVKSGASFDLSGQIEISIWYRNANSYIEKSAGVIIMGGMKVDSTFVRSQVDFSVAFEPKLELSTLADFSTSNVTLCMRLQQPEIPIKHNVYKIERIPGSKHKLREHIYRRHILRGKTYALNKKNSEMCNAVRS